MNIEAILRDIAAGEHSYDHSYECSYQPPFPSR